MDVKEESILGDDATNHWYYRSKFKALLDILKPIALTDVLDVGAGSGVFSKMMIRAGKCERAVCLDPAYPCDRVELYHGHSIRFVRSIDRVNQSLVLMMDVLEHVEDDVRLVRHYLESMPSGGKVLVTVPAFGFLWSGHDVFLGHRRRYTLFSIESRLQAAGLVILRSRFFFGALFPVVFLMRLASRWQSEHSIHDARSALRRYPPLINRTLTYIHDCERVLLFPFNRFAGLSIFCLAEKR
jgi:SAM-dependent methyltransferase